VGLGVVIEVVVVVAMMGVRREMVRRSNEVNIFVVVVLKWWRLREVPVEEEVQVEKQIGVLI
jgi:negative regulator of sigma E activity